MQLKSAIEIHLHTIRFVNKIPVTIDIHVPIHSIQGCGKLLTESKLQLLLFWQYLITI